ncbi:DUF2878 domain-containing protein [Pseudomonas sp. GCM10022188]|uniref:DUF2878 domain-containing protein n=1 Tax=Pseudomonas TaxID=286 RepID=UPI001E5275F4|nr:DUF2878 domain-containing protein [Pseudomonas oryzagri]MCC6076586.1 DUF2878 domain-containing protein [Pseudomonas oryzagri]
MRLLANAALFQLGWFACVLGAQRPALLPVAGACLLAHFALVEHRRGELKVVGAATLAGCALDSLLLNLGVLDFAGDGRVLPPWLAMLWALFATTLGHSLAWSARPWWLGSLLGALGGPLTYLLGARLAGVGLPLGLWPSLLLLALIWALLVPLLHGLRLRLAIAR